MKYSRQRNLIYNTVVDNPIHPTAEQIYGAVRKQLPNISLGTVYRNLSLLCESGVLRKIPVALGSDRYDGRLDTHFHAICRDCGQVFDVEIPEMRNIAEKVEGENGFKVQLLELTISGVCKDCKGNENAV